MIENIFETAGLNSPSREAGRSAFTTPSFSRRNSTYDLNLTRRNSNSQAAAGFSVSGNLLTVNSLEQQEANPRILAATAKPEDVPRSSDSDHTKEKRHSEGGKKASQLWGWLARRVVANRRNSLHISVVSEQEQEQEREDGVGRREEESDWLQDQFEGMTYEEIAVWVSI